MDVTPWAATGGDRAAVDELLRAVQPAVVRYCRARLGRSPLGFDAADDVAQEACLAILKSLPHYRDEGRPFLAFVYRVAANKVADAFRAAARRPTAGPAGGPGTQDGDASVVPRVGSAVEAPQRTYPEPEDHALAVEAGGRAGALLARLPPRQREVVRLRVVAGLSAEEVAEALGTTAGAVRVIQHRAVTRLRELLRAAETTRRAASGVPCSRG